VHDLDRLGDEPAEGRAQRAELLVLEPLGRGVALDEAAQDPLGHLGARGGDLDGLRAPVLGRGAPQHEPARLHPGDEVREVRRVHPLLLVAPAHRHRRAAGEHQHQQQLALGRSARRS
jgi:hypothetical protein